MSIIQAALSLDKRINYVTTSLANASSIAIPSSSQSGDLCIIYNQAGNLGSTTAVTPSGFTNVVNTTGADGAFTQRIMVSHRILDSSDPGRTVSGMTSSPVLRCLVFRPLNFTLSSITTSTPSQQTTTNAPQNQTIILTPELVERPLVALAIFSGSSGVTGQSITGGPTYTSLTNTNGVVAYATLNQGETSENTTISMPDRGNNSMASLTYTFG